MKNKPMKFISNNYQDSNINIEIHQVHKVQCYTRAFFGLRGRNVGQTDGEAGTDAVINTFCFVYIHWAPFRRS